MSRDQRDVLDRAQTALDNTVEWEARHGVGMLDQHKALVSMSSEQEGRVANELNRVRFADRDWWPSDVRVVLKTIVKVLEFDAAKAADLADAGLT